MKRTNWISVSLLLAFAGCTCGEGWRPNIFGRMRDRFHGVSNVGEPCDAGCQHAPAATGGCETCGSANMSNYGGREIYDGQVIGSYETPGSAPYAATTYPLNSGSRPLEPVQPRPSR